MQIAVGAVGHKTHVSHASSLASSQQAESVSVCRGLARWGLWRCGYACLESFVCPSGYKQPLQDLLGHFN